MKRTRNFSRKREAILMKIRDTRCHPSAEWIFQELKEEFPDLSLGTVYRNLAMFKTDGEIISVGIVNGQERFDAITYPHAHFICSSCGSVMDVETNISDLILQEDISKTYGVLVRHCELIFHGKCRSCLEA